MKIDSYLLISVALAISIRSASAQLLPEYDCKYLSEYETTPGLAVLIEDATILQNYTYGWRVGLD